jgi:hypothetical protein
MKPQSKPSGKKAVTTAKKAELKAAVKKSTVHSLRGGIIR